MARDPSRPAPPGGPGPWPTGRAPGQLRRVWRSRVSWRGCLLGMKPSLELDEAEGGRAAVLAGPRRQAAGRREGGRTGILADGGRGRGGGSLGAVQPGSCRNQAAAEVACVVTLKATPCRWHRTRARGRRDEPCWGRRVLSPARGGVCRACAFASRACGLGGPLGPRRVLRRVPRRERFLGECSVSRWVDWCGPGHWRGDRGKAAAGPWAWSPWG